MIAAVAYYRMSSDQQTDSIAQQRDEVRRLADKEGYEIVREYADEGLSGTLTDLDDRPAWQHLLLDSNKRDFKVVLMWKLNRLGRVHPYTAGTWKDTLRKNGVKVHTVSEGRQDWDSLGGLVVDLMHAEGARIYSVDIGKDSIRGRVALLNKKRWPNGPCAYGFDRLYVDPSGKEHLVARTASFRKGLGWDRLLVVNEAEAAVVRRIFVELVGNDVSIRGIAARLSKDGIPSPKGRTWTKDTVGQLVRNKAYAGYGHIGGAHTRLRSGEVHNRVGAMEAEGCCPAIVPLETWERAQEVLQARKDGMPTPRACESSVLSGILRCGHCGYGLVKHARKEKNGQRYVYYSCDTPIKRPGLGCHQWRVRESAILPAAIEALIKEVDRSVLLRAADGDEIAPAPHLESLKKHLDDLKRNIAKGTERYLTAPDSLVDQLRAKLEAWRSEAEELEREVSRQTVTVGVVAQFAASWTAMKGELVEMGIAARGDLVQVGWGEPGCGPAAHIVPPLLIQGAKVRGLLKALKLSITVFWKPGQARLGKGVSRRTFIVDKSRLVADISIHAAGVPHMRYPRKIIRVEVDFMVA